MSDYTNENTETTPSGDYTLRPLTADESTGYPANALSYFLTRMDAGQNMTSMDRDPGYDETMDRTVAAYGRHCDRLPAWATVSDAVNEPDATVVGVPAVRNGAVTSMPLTVPTEMYEAPHMRPFAEVRTRITQSSADRFPRITVDRFVDGVNSQGRRTGVEKRCLSLYPWEVKQFVAALTAAADLAMVSVPHPGGPDANEDTPETDQ